MSGMLAEVLERLTELPPEEAERVKEEALQATANMLWVPNPGPQTEAYFCEADELLYGGEPGGGKSDLGIGLSLTAHQRSLVLRRTNKEADKLPDRYEEIIGNRKGFNGQSGTWRLPGRTIDIGGCQLEKDKQKRKGIPHDLKFFDELTDFTKTQYLFIITWNRSTNPNQRCRVVASTNAPTNVGGIWVIERWAAWLDPKHPRPAKSGELRWFLRIDEDNEKEVDGPGPYQVDGVMVRARSRTFIRSKLEDNPDLAATDYASTLNAAEGEMRALAKGDFEAALEDTPGQVIPTQWVRLAQQRWTPQHPAGVPMCSIGVDSTGGGKDPMVLAPRYDGWFDRMVVVPGKSVPIERMGKHCAGIIVSHRRDKAAIIIDMGGGYGGSTYEQLKENDVEVHMWKGAEASMYRTQPDGHFGFANRRTEGYWRLREALDPGQPGGSPIMLPPDDLELMAELCTPTFEEKTKVIALEPKDKVMERLGRSPNRADAVVMAWAYGPRYITDGRVWEKQYRARGPHGLRPAVVMGRPNNRTRR